MLSHLSLHHQNVLEFHSKCTPFDLDWLHVGVNEEMAQLESKPQTSPLSPGSSKSAFKPVSQRRTSSVDETANRSRNASYSSARGAMTKELLTAQIKSFLEPEQQTSRPLPPLSPPEVATHRRLPMSPENRSTSATNHRSLLQRPSSSSAIEGRRWFNFNQVLQTELDFDSQFQRV